MQLPEFADNACRKVIYSYGHICGIYKAEQLVYLTHIVPSHCCALKLVETVEGRSTLPWLPKGQSSMLRDWLAVSKAMPTSKVSLQRESLADLGA